MRAWVDLFSARVPAVDDPAAKALVARLVADNARHMMLFRERAIAHGVDPDAYDPPREGEVIYERIDDLTGSTSWPATPRLPGPLQPAAGRVPGRRRRRGPRAIDEVTADVQRMLAALRPLAGADGARRAAEAHELYRVRELVETPRYAHAG
jgi:hypothetical protein